MVVCGGDLGILVVVVVVEAVDPSYLDLDLVLGLTCMVVLVEEGARDHLSYTSSAMESRVWAEAPLGDVSWPLDGSDQSAYSHHCLTHDLCTTSGIL